MNSTLPNAETSDELDQLLSDFFKGELKKPWPKAPFPAGATEPSELAAARAAEAPRNQPSPAGRDNTARARFTLAASVALLLGTCWCMSDGFQPGARPTVVPPQNGGGLFKDSGASGSGHPTFEKIHEDKATGNTGTPKIDMGKVE